MGTLSTGEQLWVATNCPPSAQLLQQRGPGNRSPIESPPVAKKLLKSGATASSMPSGAGTLQFLPAKREGPTPSAAGKENRSILKRTTGSSTLVAGARHKTWPGSTPRKVNFQQSVAVVVYDPSDGDYVCSESQQLNIEPRDRREFVNRTLLGLGRVRPGLQSRTTGGTIGRTAPNDSASGRPLPPVSSQDVADVAIPDLDFSFYEDSQGQLRLKFTVPLGPGVAAGDALVKANVAGNKVRVLATRTLPPRDSSGAPVRQQFSSRFALPMDVDPYGITARMDTNGNLFVEAPVLSSERRRVLAAEKHTRITALPNNTSSRPQSVN